MRFGQDDFAFLKPEEDGGLIGIEMSSEAANEDVMVLYDPVYNNNNGTKITVPT